MMISRVTGRLALLAIVLLLGATAAHSQTLTKEGSLQIDTVLQRAVGPQTIPGLVAIVANKDQTLYFNAFGLMDSESQIAMQKDSIFRIASMTKPITSAAIMMLQEEGKLSVDDPVSKYLPEFADREVIDQFNPGGTFTTRKATGPIRIRHLLTHTSGFAYNFDNEIVNRLQQLTGKQPFEFPLLYDPGTKWTYSDSTTVLGRVVQIISGLRLDQFFSDRLFRPIGMEDTFYTVPDDKHDRVVTVHQRTPGKLLEARNPSRIASVVAGEGGLFSTAADYVKFLQMFLNGGAWQGKTILSKKSIATMTQNQIGEVVVELQQAPTPLLAKPFPIGAGQDKFGFGFQITASNQDNPNFRSPGSYSWAGINNTHFWVDPKRQIAALIFMQVLPFYDETCMKTYRDFEEAIGKSLK